MRRVFLAALFLTCLTAHAVRAEAYTPEDYIRNMELTIRDSKVERALVFDVYGNFIDQFAGDDQGVTIEAPTYGFPGRIMSINHINDGQHVTFGWWDINYAAVWGLYQMRVVSRNVEGKPTLCTMTATPGHPIARTGQIPATELAWIGYARDNGLLYRCQIVKG